MPIFAPFGKVPNKLAVSSAERYRFETVRDIHWRSGRCVSGARAGKDCQASAREQTRADIQRRVSESFSKAAEQLGSDKLAVRLGGIYTLERILRESWPDYWPVAAHLEMREVLIVGDVTTQIDVRWQQHGITHHHRVFPDQLRPCRGGRRGRSVRMHHSLSRLYSLPNWKQI